MEAQEVAFDEIETVETKPQTTAVATQANDTKTVAAPASDGNAVLNMVERMMVDPNVSIERANQAWDFAMKIRDEQARKAFLEAKAAFKANAPQIIKDKENKQFGSNYASIGNVVNTANEVLSKHGLDASWEYDQGEKTIKVTCVLRHVDGHSERVSLGAPPDTSGAKNPIQQIKSTLTYLRLATYEAVTGIATREGNADDDGNAACGADPLATINDEQQAELRQLLADTDSNVGKFLEFARAESVSDILAKDFARLKAILVKKRKG